MVRNKVTIIPEYYRTVNALRLLVTVIFYRSRLFSYVRIGYLVITLNSFEIEIKYMDIIFNYNINLELIQ